MSALNDLGIFQHLELIPELYKKIETMELEIEDLKKELIPKLDLTKRAGVRSYLGVTDKTITNLMNNGKLREGEHFIRPKQKGGKIIFISSAIVDYKEKKK